MTQGPNQGDPDFGPLLLGFVGILCGATIVAAFHCVNTRCCNRRRSPSLPNRTQVAQPNQEASTPSSSSLTQFFHVYVYTKEWNEGTCAVCLSEFAEGEEVRVLPECAHTFHVPCIDMWLYSHPNCPLCRMGTMPSMEHVVVSLPISAGLSSPVHIRVSDFEG